MTEEESAGGFREGVRQGLGILSAFKEAIEETLQEARERGDLSQERAREVMRSALGRAQEAAEDARERFDFVHQKDFEALLKRVQDLQNRVEALEDDDQPASPSGES